MEFYISKGGKCNDKENQCIKFAARCKDLKLLKIIEGQGINLHVDHDAPLIAAAEEGNLEVVKFLIGKGAKYHTQRNSPLK